MPQSIHGERNIQGNFQRRSYFRLVDKSDYFDVLEIIHVGFSF